MKILVISGFLGAGKTTFIKELARRTRRDFAVMENEYGEVGIAGPHLSQAGPDSSAGLNIWELTEGCICCSTKSDFASSLLTIANTIDPEYLIVEPTGVGFLSKVMENIRQIQYERITLLAPVTILDGHSFERYQTEFREIYIDQIAAAETILVSKMEGADAQTLAQLQEGIRQWNPNAQLLTSHYSQQDDAWFESLLNKGENGQQLSTTQDVLAGLDHLGITGLELESENQLLLFLEGVVSGVFGSICRAKGYLPVGKSWLRFDVVDRRYTVTGIDPMEDSRAVFIGDALQRAWLREVLQKKRWISPIHTKMRLSDRQTKKRD